MAGFFVPPGGFTGFNSMTPASRRALTPAGGGGGAPRRRRRKAKASASPRARRKTSRKGGRKMKFGSPAWQKKFGVGKFRKK